MAASDKNRLEKRYVTLGEHDDDLGEYKIVEGLTKKDAIAFPTAALEEGEKTEIGDLAQTMSGGADGITDMDADHGNMDDEQPDPQMGKPIQIQIWKRVLKMTVRMTRLIQMRNLYQSMRHLV